MAIERVTSITQSRFAALLRYYQSGDFAAFERIIDMAFGKGSASEPYLCASMLFASQVSGLCDASTATGITRWWVSHSTDITINSALTKEIGATKAWFANHTCQVEPLITDANRIPLIIGYRHVPRAHQERRNLFDRQLPAIVPAFKDIEEQLCTEVPLTDDITGNVDVYNLASGRWEISDIDRLIGPQLFRHRKTYSSLTYYVQYTELGLRFKITQPEWAFVVAYHLLPWQLRDVLKVDTDTISFHRAVRLPLIMCRVIFAAAYNMRVGPVVMFERVAPSCIKGFEEYFKAAGERL